MSSGAILDNGSLIRKVAVPMEVFPVATVLFNLAQSLLALNVLFLLAFVFLCCLYSPGWLFPMLVLHVLFTFGACFVVATARVFYRDVRHFTEILLMIVKVFLNQDRTRKALSELLVSDGTVKTVTFALPLPEI